MGELSADSLQFGSGGATVEQINPDQVAVFRYTDVVLDTKELDRTVMDLLDEILSASNSLLPLVKGKAGVGMNVKRWLQEIKGPWLN